jgi:hypothetical protein
MADGHIVIGGIAFMNNNVVFALDVLGALYGEALDGAGS